MGPEREEGRLIAWRLLEAGLSRLVYRERSRGRVRRQTNKVSETGDPGQFLSLSQANFHHLLCVAQNGLPLCRVLPPPPFRLRLHTFNHGRF